MNDSEVKNGEVMIRKPGLECPAIILSAVIWIVILLWWLNSIYK